MIRRSSEKKVDVKKMFDGDGEVILNHILNTREEMYDKGRVFSHVVIRPGCAIGNHVHRGDGETYYILKGQGEYNDNGVTVTVGPGDVTFVDAEQEHGIRCIGDEPLELIALVLFK